MPPTPTARRRGASTLDILMGRRPSGCGPNLSMRGGRFRGRTPDCPRSFYPVNFRCSRRAGSLVTVYNSLADTAAPYVEETAVQLAPELAGESRAFRLTA